MLDDPTARKGLMISIVGGIVGTMLFIIFINPILQAVLSLLQILSSKAYTEFANYICKEAALGHKNDIDVLFLTALAGVSFALSFECTTILLFRKNIVREGALSLTRIAEKTTGILGRLSFLLSLLLFNILLIFIVTATFASSGLNVSFHQRVTVLAPYLSEQEEEELAAMWASMKNRQDYEHINKQLNNYAQKITSRYQCFYL